MDIRTQINKSGRLVIPAKMRRELKIRPGDEIVLRIENGSIRLIPLNQAINIAQNVVKKYVPTGVSLVDLLIQERRDEVERG